MYSVVLMMALSGGGDASMSEAALVEPVAQYGDHGHKQNRLFGGRRCHGCCGGSTACHGGRARGCHGCHGGSVHGCCGGAYVYGSMPYATGYYGSSTWVAPGYYGAMPDLPDYTYGSLAVTPAPAALVVRLPADARLTIQGSPTISTESVRTFMSPPLDPGKEFEYTLKAQVTRNGKTIERTRTVTVRAGQRDEVTIDLPAPVSPPE